MSGERAVITGKQRVGVALADKVKLLSNLCRVRERIHALGQEATQSSAERQLLEGEEEALAAAIALIGEIVYVESSPS